MSELYDLMTSFKSAYLDSRGIGIRRFAIMTQINRTRLTQIFAGTKMATPNQIASITQAMDVIERQQTKTQTLKSRLARKAIHTD
jgi:hypothetical protein